MNEIANFIKYKQDFIKKYGDENSSVFAQSHLMLVDSVIEVFGSSKIQAVLDRCWGKADKYAKLCNKKLEEDILNFSKRNNVPVEQIRVKYLLPLIDDEPFTRRYELFVIDK